MKFLTYTKRTSFAHISIDVMDTMDVVSDVPLWKDADYIIASTWIAYVFATWTKKIMEKDKVTQNQDVPVW